MAGPFKKSIKIYQGQDLDDLSTWKAGTPAVPVDLTGCTARMQIRPSVDSSDVLLELTTANNRIVLGGVDGTINLLLTAAETSAITWLAGTYDLEIIMSTGKIRRLMYGGVSVSKEVTR